LTAAVVLDTDVASQVFKRRPHPILTRLVGTQPVISFVTRAELDLWARLHGWGPSSWRRLEAWLTSVPVLPGTEGVAAVWAEITAEARRRGRPRPQNDTWIAACALFHGLPLATLNVKDFEDFAQHHGLGLVTG
jgi:predicted nucleic acid-binding protein